MRLNSTLSRTHNLFPLTISLLLFIIYCLPFYCENYQYDFFLRIEILVYSLSTKFELDSFLNIGDLLADTHKQTHTQTEYNSLPI